MLEVFQEAQSLPVADELKQLGHVLSSKHHLENILRQRRNGRLVGELV